MQIVSEICISADYPSVLWIFSTMDGEFENFFCFLSWRLLFLTDEVSESDVLLTVMVRLSLRNMGVSCLDDGFDCIADGPAVSDWVGGAAIGTCGPKCSICVKSGLFAKASSCLGLRFGIGTFKAWATLLEMDIQERPEKTDTIFIRFSFVAFYLFAAQIFPK